MLDRRLWSLIALAIAAPLAYAPRITAMRHTSLAALGCVMLITIMVILFAFHPFYPFLDACPLTDESSGIHGDGCSGPTVLYSTPEKTLRSLPLFVFSCALRSYSCGGVAGVRQRGARGGSWQRGRGVWLLCGDTVWRRGKIQKCCVAVMRYIVREAFEVM